MILTTRGKLQAELAATILAGFNRKHTDRQGECEAALEDAELIIRLVESEEEDAAGSTLVDVSKVDWELLNRQKTWLLCFEPDFDGQADEDEERDAEHARGLVNFIDHVQDSAVEAGLSPATVFGVSLAKD